MDGPRASMSARSARRRSRRRRRRLAGLGGAVVLAALLVVFLNGSGGGTRRAPRASDGKGLPSGYGAVPPPVVPPPGADRSASSKTIRRLVRLGLPIYCGGPHGHEVAFTFDDGPGVYTNLALRKLALARERATFFVVGRSMDQYPGYVRRELKVAAIGDHTYTHPELTALSPSQITWQLSATAHKIEAQSGKHVDLFRPPYELHNATVDRIAQRLGLLEILWSVDSQDSLGANYAHIITNVEAGLHPGAIVLMHENRGQTIRALAALLPELHRRHLRSVTLPQLLASDPPSPARVHKGPRGCLAGGKLPAIGGH